MTTAKTLYHAVMDIFELFELFMKFYCLRILFSKLAFLKNFFHENHQSLKQFGAKSWPEILSGLKWV